MAQRMRDGFGVETKYGPHLWLDVRHLGDEHLRTKLREVWDICRDFVGLDPAEELEPIELTSHLVDDIHDMGGTMRLGAYPCEIQAGTLEKSILAQSQGSHLPSPVPCSLSAHL